MNDLFERFMANGTNTFGRVLLQIILLQIALSFAVAFKRNSKEKYRNGIVRSHNQRQINKNGNYVVCEITALLIMIGGSQYIDEKKAPLYWIIVLNFIVISAFVLVVGKLKWQYAIITAGLTTASLIVSMSAVYWQGYKWNDNTMMQSAGICFLIFLLIDLILNKQTYKLSGREWMILIVDGIVSIGIIFSQYKMGGEKPTVISIAGAIFNYGILIYLIFQMKDAQLREQQYLEIVKANDLQKQYMESVYQLDEQARRVRHDVKNHINTINMLLKDDEHGLERTREYIAQYADSTSIMQEYVKSKNQVVNAVINSKLMYCNEHEICTSASVDQNVDRLSDVELCCVLGNLLDNAIEAELKNPKGQRNIDISVTMHEEVMEILIKNRILSSVLQANKDLKTTKTNLAQHGFGMQNIRDIVSKNDGYLDIYEEGEFFCCEVRI